MLLQDQELLPDQGWRSCRFSELLLAQKVLLKAEASVETDAPVNTIAIVEPRE